MAEGTSRVRALFMPILSTLKAALTSEKCEEFARRKVEDNDAALLAKDISYNQALDYLNQLEAMTEIYGGKQCSSIVTKTIDSFKPVVAKR